MKELGYKYTIIEEVTINDKKIYKIKDNYNSLELFAKEYEKIDDMNFEDSFKIEEKLALQKKNGEIFDFLNINDYESSKKIFYQLLKELKDNPFNNLEDDIEDNLEDNIENNIEDNLEDNIENNLEDNIEDSSITFDKASINIEESRKEIKSFKDSSKDSSITFDKENRVKKKEEIILCNFCERIIKSENIKNNMGYCYNCKSIREVRKIPIKEVKRRVKQIKAPKGIEVLSNDSILSIKVSLNKFNGLWNIFASIMVYIFFLSDFSDRSPNAPLYSVIFFYGMMAFLLYLGILKFINKIKIEVTNEKIVINSKPLPHILPKEYLSSEISQIYVKKSKNQKEVTYSLYLAFQEYEAPKNIITLNNSEYLLYLERIIEDWLKIEDIPVKGEFKV